MSSGRRPTRVILVAAGVLAAGAVVAGAVHRGRPAFVPRATPTPPNRSVPPESSAAAGPPPAGPTPPPAGSALPKGAASPEAGVRAAKPPASPVRVPGEAAPSAASMGSRGRKGLAAAVVLTAALSAGLVLDHHDRAEALTRPSVGPLLTGPSPAGASTPSVWLPPITWSYSPPPPPPPPLPVPAGEAVPVGQTVILDGDSGEWMHLTLVRAEDPAPYQDPHDPSAVVLDSAIGHRLVTAAVRVENVGGVPFVDDLENHTRLVDEDGTEYEPDAGMTELRNPRPAARVDPRYISSRQIVFEVRGDVDLVLLRVSGYPGSGGGTQDWTLDSMPRPGDPGRP